jgi:hypothetical protein
MSEHDDDDEFDSPFAHVPAADAGPLPFQDGYWTYEKSVQAVGRVGASSRYALRGLALVFVWVLIVGALLGLLLTLLR